MFLFSIILSFYLFVLLLSLLVVRICPHRLLSAMGGRLCCLAPCAASWTGGYQQRRKHGHGIHHHNNGDVYEGDYRDDEKHGKGAIRWADGSSYDGDWLHDRPHGQGIWKAATTAASPTSAAVAPATRREDPPPPSSSHSSADPPTFPPPSSYSGGWVSGEKSGTGVLMYSDGAIYTGSFLHDLPHGQGELVRKDGSCFIGEWRDGRYHGAGVLTRVNGDVLEGRFVRGQLEGEATVRRYCGDEVTGSFVRGQLKGRGAIRRRVPRDDGRTRKPTLPSPRSRSAASVATSRSYEDLRGERDPGEEESGEVGYLRYEGEVSADFEMHGWGTTFFPTGDQVWAQWRHGGGVGRDGEVGERMYCVYTYACGDVWDGEMREWRRDGEGELRYADGRMYTGHCVDDVKEGQGTYEDGLGLYSGRWLGDEREGVGVMEYRDGRRYEGEFARDRRHGKGVLYYAEPTTAGMSPAPSSPTAAPPAPPEDLFISEWREGRVHVCVVVAEAGRAAAAAAEDVPPGGGHERGGRGEADGGPRPAVCAVRRQGEERPVPRLPPPRLLRHVRQRDKGRSGRGSEGMPGLPRQGDAHHHSTRVVRGGKR